MLKFDGANRQRDRQFNNRFENQNQEKSLRGHLMKDYQSVILFSFYFSLFFEAQFQSLITAQLFFILVPLFR